MPLLSASATITHWFISTRLSNSSLSSSVLHPLYERTTGGHVLLLGPFTRPTDLYHLHLALGVRRWQYQLSGGNQPVNQQGNISSPTALINTGHIIKPPTPEITKHFTKPLEIFWNMQCHESFGSSAKNCEVQYRTRGQQDWTRALEKEILGGFRLRSSQPYTWYEFQVRCACQCDCPHDLMSDWSPSYKLQTPEAAPLNMLDVWIDDVTSELSQCAVMWKDMSPWLAQRKILQYVVTLFYSNDTSKNETVAVSESGEQSVCQQNRCHFNSSLQGVTGVTVSAYNSQGATKQAHLAIPTSSKGLHFSEVPFTVNMNESSLNASWFLLNQTVEEYVVQYKAGSFLTKGFDWIKVDKNQKSVFLKGAFESFTPYNVSLFAVFVNSSRLLASEIAYSIHGLPPKVPNLNVDLSDSNVIVTWTLILPSRSIVAYCLILDNKTVHNVSGNQRSFTFSGLSPGEHSVSIMAKTEAGLGPSETRKFNIHTQGSGYSMYLVPMILVFIIFIIIITIIKRLKKKWCCWEKVPDPKNSLPFQKFNSSWTQICLTSESTTKLSELEILGSPRKRSSLNGLTEESTHTRSPEEKEPADLEDYRDKDWLQRAGRQDSGKEGYSQMIDTEEEKDGEETLSEDEQFVSDYEKHFLPVIV
ncbi:hypothetical protein UPYG_G00103000 [Umbra pygmaea]|uniref:Fibronectin type-III domain-containing protein n=1 Tax=Umbra pygmaea TaxID=75934 RepID=A0ABD0X549_UMBPY